MNNPPKCSFGRSNESTDISFQPGRINFISTEDTLNNRRALVSQIAWLIAICLNERIEVGITIKFILINKYFLIQFVIMQSRGNNQLLCHIKESFLPTFWPSFSSFKPTLQSTTKFNTGRPV